MLGFLLGSACLVGVVAVARGGRRWRMGGNRWGRGFGCGAAAGHGAWGQGKWRGGGWAGEGRARDFMLRSLFERLDATPGQEKVFLAAAEELRRAREKVREEMATSRGEVAQALRGEHFDPAAIRNIFARHDLLISEIRNAALDSLSKIDEALDPRQRKLLADLIGSGPGFGGRAPAYRDYV